MLLVSMVLVASACGGADDASGSAPTGAAGRDATSDAAVPADAGSASAGAYPDLSGRTITVTSSGGELAVAERTAYWEPFEELTGASIEVVEVDYSTLPTNLLAQVDAGDVEWDLISGLAPSDAIRLGEKGALQSLPLDDIPGLADLAEGTYFAYGVANEVDAWYTTYSLRDGVEPLTGAADFFDPSIVGPRSAAGSSAVANINCAIALVADGVAPEDIAPIDVPRCLSVWDRIKDQVTVWWGSGSEMAQTLIDDSVDYCICLDGRTLQAMKTNPEWGFSHRGAEIVLSYLSVAKDSPNLDIALELIDFTTKAEQQAKFVELLGYSGPNPNAVDFLPDELKPFLSTTPENRDVTFQPTPEQDAILADNADDVARAWDEWISQ